ncbi:transmembrane amino acid transporter family protein [Actinidia rufa]|uniref:Transmembrane amino acid transporter family protein n=1 Tax=Actinidia rufa TaxID=165716 RepID=A0A7J0GFA7_9ERIC|nr:transmembrane amino acid transporter family protein [Actinidia rufa]
MSEAPEISSTPSTPHAAGPPPAAAEQDSFSLSKALQMTKLDRPQDTWLPITESRNGNAYYAAFHTLCSGIGIQALILPFAFYLLGWAWGLICLTITFIWQLYTLWVLVQLHESTETGMRYNRYLQLCCATFGDKLGKWLALFPIMYLSGGTCVALIVIGGSTLNRFFQYSTCGNTCRVMFGDTTSNLLFRITCSETCSLGSLTIVEWYLVFTCVAVVLSQLPNLNSIAGVSLIGAVTAVGYCTLTWAVSVAEGRIREVSYEPFPASPLLLPYALGIIAFAFRGHNLILEIQATMPSSNQHPSHVPMWKGVKFAYLLIAMCIFPVAIVGFWAYGSEVPADGGILAALYEYRSRDVSTFVLGLISFLIIVNALSSFPIYAMPMLDQMESLYTSRFNKPCTWWLRAIFRCVFLFQLLLLSCGVPVPRQPGEPNRSTIVARHARVPVLHVAQD